MKTVQAIPHFLVASVLVLGTACSTTNTGTSAAGGSTAGSTATTTTPMGSDMNPTSTPDANSGMTASGALPTTGAAAPATGASGAAGGAATDMNAFMGTFATMQDPVFLLNAASSNLLEIQVGQTASQQATNPNVKKFAQMMVSHHTKATQQLKTVATPLGVVMPQTMLPVHQAMADRLLNKTGKGFDEAYMDLMETAHKMDIAMFEVKSKAAETPTVQTFATNTLPMLRSHRDMASALEKKVD